MISGETVFPGEPSFIALAPAPSLLDERSLLSALQGVRLADLSRWYDRLRESGIQSRRLGCPNLLRQMHQLLRRPIDAVLCNLLDDAGEGVNAALSNRHHAAIVAATALLGRITGARHTHLVIETDQRGDWRERSANLRRELDVSFLAVRNDYPQADPTLLLYAALGRRLRPGRLPTEQGVLLLDGWAAVQIGLCLADQSCAAVPLAITDHTSNRTLFAWAPRDVGIREILLRLNLPADGVTLRRGPILRDWRVDPDEIIGDGELTLHITGREPPLNPDPCIRCAWCIEGCPTRVQPAAVLEAAQRGDAALAERFGIEACIECGICSYVCPSHLPLLRAVRTMRTMGTQVRNA